MTIKYNQDTNCEVYTCSVCGHVYHNYYDFDKQAANREAPFVKLEEPLLMTVSCDWGPDGIERVSQYACPVCGVLQVDTNYL